MHFVPFSYCKNIPSAQRRYRSFHLKKFIDTCEELEPYSTSRTNRRPHRDCWGCRLELVGRSALHIFFSCQSRLCKDNELEFKGVFKPRGVACYVDRDPTRAVPSVETSYKPNTLKKTSLKNSNFGRHSSLTLYHLFDSVYQPSAFDPCRKN